MTSDPFALFVALAAAGGGLVLAGVLGVLVPGRARLAAAGSAGLALAAAAVASPPAVPLTAAVLAAAFLAAAALGCRRLGAARAWAGRLVVKPAAAAVAGLVVVVASVVALDAEQEAQVAANTDVIDLSATMPPLRKPTGAAAVTDRGTRIELMAPADPRDPTDVRAKGRAVLPQIGAYGMVIRRGPADERTNCFGWVFAQGRYWLPGAGIDPILSDHAYRPVADPRPGDVAVYREASSGQPTHAAVVRYVTAGQPVLVEGKWGWMGVFLHDADRSPYGTTYSYYRTTRPTHQLALTTPDSGPDGPLLGAE